MLNSRRNLMTKANTISAVLEQQTNQIIEDYRDTEEINSIKQAITLLLSTDLTLSYLVLYKHVLGSCIE